MVISFLYFQLHLNSNRKQKRFLFEKRLSKANPLGELVDCLSLVECLLLGPYSLESA